MNALRTLVETCNFEAPKDQLIRDRRKLLQESKLTLEKYVDVCRAAEATSAQVKEIAPGQQQQRSSRFSHERKSLEINST